MSRNNLPINLNYLIHTRARDGSFNPNNFILQTLRDHAREMATNHIYIPSYVAAEEEVSTIETSDVVSLVTQDQENVEEMVLDDGHASPPFIDDDDQQFDEQNDDVGAVVEIESDNSNQNQPGAPSMPIMRVMWSSLHSNIINNASSAQNEMVNDENAIVPVDNIVVESSTQSAKKRKLAVVNKTPSPKQSKEAIMNDDDDDGQTCPICLDSWEMSGQHRLVSLKCGHLFGHSCIRRWINESAPGTKSCPSCKTRAAIKDIRNIYAKKVFVVDKSEEYRLENLIAEEQKRVSKLQMELNVLRIELSLQTSVSKKLEENLQILKKKIVATESAIQSNDSNGGSSNDANNVRPAKMYKLFMEKNIEISKEAGCRVMIYASKFRSLICSQKSASTLFPGYGIRFLDDFRPSTFVHVSEKQVRDLHLDADEEYLIAASLDKCARLINVNTRTITNVFTPSDKALWASAFDCQRTKLLYLGAQHGSTYTYDIRNQNVFINEYKTEGDMSPVVNICSVPTLPNIQFGGFLVCKLQSIWFFEYTETQEVIPQKLFITGPFVSMSYDLQTNFILISTRVSTALAGCSQYIIGQLDKINNQTIIFNTIETISGSTMLPVMSRCTQINHTDQNLLVGYLQDTKMLTTWNLLNKQKMQSLPITDTVYDTCPIYMPDGKVYLSALTENKCRIYKVEVTQ